MNERRRTFRGGEADVVQPLLRAVLSYAPCEDGISADPTEWVVLAGVDGVIRLRLACVTALGAGVPGPFGSMFYSGKDFEVIVPFGRDEADALLMINLLGEDAPSTFEFDTVVPHGWTMRVELDGSVTILGADGAPQIYLGAPWAFGADSVPVLTRYRVVDGRLTQHVDVGPGTAFPVLVDPDPDAVFTGDGHLVTEEWAPRLVPEVGDSAD